MTDTIRLLYPLPILLAIVMSGCNSDIFLDEHSMPENQSVSIEGDGGEAMLTVPVGGLEYLGLDLTSSSKRYCQYYNKNGEVIDSESPASEVHKILFETRFTKLEVIRNGSKIKVRSICETSSTGGQWSIRLEYSFGVRFITVEVLPGKPVRLVEVIYNDDMLTADRAKVSGARERFNNNGPLPQTVTILPYLNELATILVLPEYRESWLLGERFNMPVPVYANGEWTICNKDGIIPGHQYTFAGPDRMTEVLLTVPAYSDSNIFTDVIYSGAKVSGEMIFRNEVLDRTFSEKITVTSFYPVGHEIRIEDAK